MSRVGKKVIVVPDGVKVSLADRTVTVEGPVGKLSWTYRPEITVRLAKSGKEITVERSSDQMLSRSLHGLTRSLIANMVEGCAKGFTKELELYGVGYGVRLQGTKLVLTCGKSHPVSFDVPQGLTLEVARPQARGDNEPARFVIKGADKQAVGEFAARVRKAHPPEPYKGKGVRYVGEYVRRKVGKAFVGTGA
ncbi:MAG: 50S ribosomal protein L6 [Phycisphaerae bacterium]|nr:50S ribosomal protein L6 [Phycisphaerae bacterium]